MTDVAERHNFPEKLKHLEGTITGASRSKPAGAATGRLRVLVAIASYGVKHLDLLKKVISRYQSMALDVDIVVLSEAPKDLGPDIEVVVGLPATNPWSLPFAHKSVFAQRAKRYELFIYTEDDNDIAQDHLDSFLNAAPQLAPDEVPGFLRYEVAPSGERSMDEVFEHYHWKPESVRRRGSYTVAEFTNEHAGFYILTQAQLQRAIASGGFLREPYEGRYCLPETAATDPYTSCGFRKVICISALERFLIHHMDNRYVSRHMVTFEQFKQQVQTLLDIRNGAHPASTLCQLDSKFWHCRWHKSYYEEPVLAALALMPHQARNILSIGCGWGASEAEFIRRGAQVTALPLDSVIGAVAARRGIEVVHGSLEEGLRTLRGRTFDGLFISNLLHLQRHPRQFLASCLPSLGPGGSLVLTGPNFERLPWRIQRMLGRGDFWKLRSFESSGISVCGPGSLAKILPEAGVPLARIDWLDHHLEHRLWRGKVPPLGRFTAKAWALLARRQRAA